MTHWFVDDLMELQINNTHMNDEVTQPADAPEEEAAEPTTPSEPEEKTEEVAA